MAKVFWKIENYEQNLKIGQTIEILDCNERSENHNLKKHDKSKILDMSLDLM